MATWRQLDRYGDDVAVSMLLGQGEQRRMILLPFEGEALSSSVVQSALTMAEATSAELVLLCIRSPAEKMRQAEEDEHLFSDLKGLQARLQPYSASVKIRIVTGSVAQFLLDYTRRHNTRLIMIPGYPADVDANPMA